MKFTVERTAFVKMIKTVAKRMPGQKKADSDLHLSACAARVFVESNQTVAGVEGLVFADGQCVLPLKRFLKVLQTYGDKKHLMMEVDEHALRIGNFSMLVSRYSSSAKPPGKFQVFPVTDLAALFPESKPPEQTPATPPETEPAQEELATGKGEDSFLIDEGEIELIEEVISFARRICTLPKITPVQLAGMARALFALERLPSISNGVDVDFSLSVRSGNESDYTEQWATVHISDTCFTVSRLFVTYDAAVGGDHQSSTVYEVEKGGFNSLVGANSSDWFKVVGWIDHVRGMLDGNKPANLSLHVTDDSASDCMATGDEQ